jgi:hypothetical protein
MEKLNESKLHLDAGKIEKQLSDFSRKENVINRASKGLQVLGFGKSIYDRYQEDSSQQQLRNDAFAVREEMRKMRVADPAKTPSIPQVQRDGK